MLFTFMLLMKVVCLNVPFSCSNSDLFSKFFKNGKFCNWNHIYPHVHTQTHSHNSLNHKFHNIVFPLLKSVFSYLCLNFPMLHFPSGEKNTYTCVCVHIYVKISQDTNVLFGHINFQSQMESWTLSLLYRPADYVLHILPAFL